MKRLLLVPER